MKKFALILTVISLFFSVSAFASKETITDSEKISSIINECYPHLRGYYGLGVMKVESLTEETLADGSTEYNIRYKFVNNYFEQDEIDSVLKSRYPDVYRLSKAGVIKDVCVYYFVDKDSGKIMTNVAYNRSIPSPRQRFGR